MPTGQRSKGGTDKKGFGQAFGVCVSVEGGSLRRSAGQARGGRLRSSEQGRVEISWWV